MVDQGKFRDHYLLGQLIGSGSFADVYKCKCKDTGNTRAVKRIKKEFIDKK